MNPLPSIRRRALQARLLALVLTLAACAGAPASVPLAGGRVAYRLEGLGSPTVVLQAGLGDGAASWRAIQERLAGVATSFAHDRPGYGGSPAAAGPRDPCASAATQRAALAAAGLRPPYVLVGHSLGGLYQYVYALRYPEEVAALVLIEPTHPDHWRRMQAEAPALAATVRGARLLFGDAMRREFDEQAACLDGLDRTRRPAVRVRLLVRSRFAGLESGSFERMVRETQQDWLALTGAARAEQVADSGHYVHRDQPQRVADVIAETVRRVRAGAS